MKSSEKRIAIQRHALPGECKVPTAAQQAQFAAEHPEFARRVPKTRPILFSAPMVREVRAGRKTQTRRVVKDLGSTGKPVGPAVLFWRRGEDDPLRWVGCDGLGAIGHIYCPYGEPGDLLRVRESFRTASALDGRKPSDLMRSTAIHYEADRAKPGLPWGKLRPGIFLPSWASRDTLEITSVRIERVQEISEADIAAEGVDVDAALSMVGWKDTARKLDALDCEDLGEKPFAAWTPRDCWRAGWSAINGAESWAANPWVWALGFRRLP